MSFRPDRPFNDLPGLPPQAELETRSILKACIEARAALAGLRMAGHLIPNQALLINAVPVLEAQSSSEIENIVTTTDQLFRYANNPENAADPATKEALRYRTALQQGYRTLADRSLSTRTAIDICATIKGVEMDIRAVPGVTLRNDATNAVIYTPPEGSDRLRDMLGNWERFIHGADTLDPLVRMAVIHYQFEAIHPFTDGNGRTGRILNLLFLIEKGLLDLPVLYLSRYLIQHCRDYYRLLLAVTTNGDWESWILYILDAVRETSLWTTAMIMVVRDLLDRTAKAMKAGAPKIYTRELVDLIFVQPYCRISDLVEAGIAQRQAASTYLQALVRIGILEERKVGREKLFINPALVKALTVP